MMRFAFALWLTMLPCTPIVAQGGTPFQVPTTNPTAVVRERVSATDVVIDYHRPSMKGRRIYGGLVPFGQVWRTGSDNATRVSFSTPVAINGVAVDSGTYELFSVPGEKEWTIMLQRARQQWGSYAYDPANDAARVSAQPIALSEPVETFTIGIGNAGPASADLEITWETTRVPVHITVDIRATALPKVEAALAVEGRKPYFTAAMFYFENDLDIGRAVELMTLALAAQPTHIGMLYRHALILERKGDIPGAIAAAEKSLAGAQGSGPELKREYTSLNNTLLARLRRR